MPRIFFTALTTVRTASLVALAAAAVVLATDSSYFKTVWYGSQPYLPSEDTCRLFRDEVLTVPSVQGSQPLDVLFARIEALAIMEKCEEVRFGALQFTDPFDQAN